MISSPTQPKVTSRATGKSRASDVGYRARLATAQNAAQVAAVARPAVQNPLQPARALPPSDTRPNELREAWNAQLMASLTHPVPKPQVRGRPTQADLHHGNMYVNWVRKGIIARIPCMQEKEIPAEEDEQYRLAFDTLWGHVFEMDALLHVYACWMAEDTVRQLIIITTVVKQQKIYLSSGNPRHILDLQSIRMFLHVVQSMREAITNAQKAMLRPAESTPAVRKASADVSVNPSKNEMNCNN